MLSTFDFLIRVGYAPSMGVKMSTDPTGKSVFFFRLVSGDKFMPICLLLLLALKRPTDLQTSAVLPLADFQMSMLLVTCSMWVHI
jgi:hypothetical protein